MTMTQTQISKQDEASLSRAYMHLYKKLVTAYMSDGNSGGQSQFNAICVMREIVMGVVSQNISGNDGVTKFLAKLYNTHKGVVAKRTMLIPDQAEICPIENDCATQVNNAISELVNVIHDVSTRNVLAVFEKGNARQNILPNKKSKSFEQWLNTEANPADVDKLMHYLPYFAKLYNKFVMRQSHK